MIPAKKQPKSWLEALKLISRCPICNTPYEVQDAKLFAEQENTTLVHITCRQCSSAFLSMMMRLGQGLSSVGMITDLNFTDAEKIYHLEPISLDEAIAGYEFIQTNKFF